jgi:CDP-diacylglycerol---glycerol-3-phosphate 3-phosphatidyltransferase
MFTLPNLLSLCRFPLAFCFIFGTPYARIVVLIIAFLTDVFDGFLARQLNSTSRLGVWLDPLADKFFVILSLAILYHEDPLDLWKVAAMFCRDLSIIIFTFYLALRGHLATYYPRAIWCGKVSTGLQLLVLGALTLKTPIPNMIFFTFFVFGSLALVELYLTKKQVPSLT